MLTTMTIAGSAFLATNSDNLVLLMLLRADPRVPGWQLSLGYLLAMTLLLAVCLAMSWLAPLLPLLIQTALQQQHRLHLQQRQ